METCIEPRDLSARCSQVVIGCVSETNTHRCPIFGISLLVFGAGSVYYMWNYLNRKNVKKHLVQSIEDRKVKVRLQKESVCMGLTGSEQTKCADDKLRSRIVALSAEQLLQDISEGRFTVQQVLQAYRAEAYRADLRTNCITEFLDEAEDQARYLDTIEIKGPLHGLPISIKETYHLKCHDCTAGLAKLIGIPSQRDAVLVMVLKKLGAIPFARTNIVQTTCSMGNGNPIYGETVNPHCKDRVPGGSSCGEGALIGLGGSLVGLGTDVGGSLRIPAALCGVYSIKPTQNRLSGLGVKKSIDGMTGLFDCPGLMAREMQALVVVFRALVGQAMFHADPRVVPLSFQKDLFNIQRPLKIGYYDDDGCITPTPGCRRAVYVAKGALEKMGHEVTCFTVPQVEKAFEITMSLFCADGGKSMEKMLENEPYVSKSLINKEGIFSCIKEAILGKQSLPGGLSSSTVNGNGRQKTTFELWQLLAERDEYVDMFIQTWRCLNLDAIIAPGYALPAFNSNFIIPLGDTVFITMLYNMLNFPVGAVPVTRETDDDQKALDQDQPEDSLRKCMKKAAIGAVGLPLGVQVIGLPWQEELVLRVMKDLELGLKTNCEPEELRCTSPMNSPNTIKYM